MTGWDAAGVIARAAADGSGHPEGTRVVGLVDAGAWAELVAIPTDRWQRSPTRSPTRRRHAAHRRHDGAAGARGRRSRTRQACAGHRRDGVGRIAIQLARRAAPTSPRWCATRGKVQHLRALGAADVVESVDGDFDLIVDAVGGPTFGLAIEHLAARGIVVNIATQSHDETVTFRAARFDRAKGEDLHPEPPRRARVTRQRRRRPRPALPADGRGTTRRPDRARILVA